MPTRAKPRCTDTDMRLAVALALRNFGHARFKLPDGPHGVALDEAQRAGWVWCPRPGVACITPAGAVAVQEYVPRGAADAD